MKAPSLLTPPPGARPHTIPANVVTAEGCQTINLEPGTFVPVAL